MEIKVENNENYTTLGCLQQEVIKYNTKFENEVKPQSMFITFTTEHNEKRMCNVINTDQENVEVKCLSPNIIVNITLDQKLRMTPIVKLERLIDNSILANNFIHMPPPNRKCTKNGIKSGKSSERSANAFKKKKLYNKRSNSVVQEVNLQSYRNYVENIYYEKQLDTVSQCQIKGQFVNINNQICDMYPNDCTRATSNINSLVNNETTNLMKHDFEYLWEKQKETSMCDSNNDLSKLFSGVQTRRSIRRGSNSSKSSIENVSNTSIILASPKVNKTKKFVEQTTPDKGKLTDAKIINKTANKFIQQIKSESKPKVEDFESINKQIKNALVETHLLQRKETTRKRKLNNSPIKCVFNTLNESCISLDKSLDECPDNLSDKNTSQTLSKKTKSIKKSNKLKEKNIARYNTKSDIKDAFVSDIGSVLSSPEIFSQNSNGGIASDGAVSKLNNKIKLSRYPFLSEKVLRKKLYTKSDILSEVIPRITSNHYLFNQHFVLSEEEIDLENLKSVSNDESQKIQVHDHSRNVVVNETVKNQLPDVKENPIKHITDLRDIISRKPVMQDSKYVPYFEVKRPPLRTSSNCSSKQKSVNRLSSFSSNNSNSFLAPLSFQQRNFQPVEDDVLSIYADSVIVNNSPISDQGHDDIDDGMDGDYSQNFSNFSEYDNNDEQIRENSSVLDFEVNSDNVKKTTIEENQIHTDLCPNGIVDMGEKNSSTGERSLLQTETESTFVSFSAESNQINKISSDLFQHEDAGIELNPSQLSKPVKLPLSCEIKHSSVHIDKSVDISRNETISSSSNKSQLNEEIHNIMLTNESTPNNKSKNAEKLEKKSPSLSPNKNVKNNFIKQTNNIEVLSSLCKSNINSLKSPDRNDTINDEFRAIFQNVCFRYLEYGFCGMKDSFDHQIPSNYDQVLQKLSRNEISRTYNNFVCFYSFLLEKTIPTFAKYFGKFEDEINLFDMVRKLQNLKAVKAKVRLNLMKSILDGLNDFMEYHVAIEKIFENIAKKDINTIDILLELLLDEPSIENNWNLIKKLTSVEDYEIPLKVVEFILNDCCNRLKIRKFYVKNVYNDVITKIADVNLLKIPSVYVDKFLKVMENLELNCVNDLKNRLETCKNGIKNNAFKVPTVPAVSPSPSSSSSSNITIVQLPMFVQESNIPPRIPILSDNYAVLDSHSNDEDRYSPTTSTNIQNHQPYKSRSMHNYNKNISVSNKRQFNYHNFIRNIVRAFRNDEFFHEGINELRRYSQRPNFNRIVNAVANQLPQEIAQRVINSVYNNGYNYKDLSPYRFKYRK